MPDACERCTRPIEAASSYELAMPEAGSEQVCFRCALKDPVMLKRSARVAIVVGTLLVLLNQGDAILGGPPFAEQLFWKVPLTYCVPFCVATYGALGNASR